MKCPYLGAVRRLDRQCYSPLCPTQAGILPESALGFQLAGLGHRLGDKQAQVHGHHGAATCPCTTELSQTWAWRTSAVTAVYDPYCGCTGLGTVWLLTAFTVHGGEVAMRV